MLAIGIGLPLWGLWLTTTGAIRGTGDTRSPMVRGLVTTWLAVVIAAIGVYRFRYGDWLDVGCVHLHLADCHHRELACVPSAEQGVSPGTASSDATASATFSVQSDPSNHEYAEDPVRTISKLANSIERSGIRDLMDAAREMDGPIIHLEVGEPSFITPPHIIEQAFEAASAGATRYTQSGGVLPLRQAIADRYTEKWGKPVTPNMVMASHGGVNAINSTILALIDPGDEVLVPDPGWPNYKSILGLAHGVPVRVSPWRSRPVTCQMPRRLEALITSKTKMIITCNPGNPTGAVWPAETVEAIVKLAKKHDLYVLSDEIYEELVFDGEHVPATQFDDDGRVITVSGFSKTYAMTGWRLGWAIADEKLLGMINKMLEPLVSCPSSISQQAGIAALRGPQQAVSVMRKAYKARRDIAVSILEPAGLLPVRPKGAFYAIVDLRSCGIKSRELALTTSGRNACGDARLATRSVRCWPTDSSGFRWLPQMKTFEKAVNGSSLLRRSTLPDRFGRSAGT